MELRQHLRTQGAMMPSTPIQTFARHKLQGLVMQDPHSVVNSIISGTEHLFPRVGTGKTTRSEQWGSHGFTVVGGLYLDWQVGPRQGPVCQAGETHQGQDVDWLPVQHGVMNVTEVPWPGAAGTAAQRRQVRVRGPRQGLRKEVILNSQTR